MMLCGEHRINDAMRNDERCIYCQRDAYKAALERIIQYRGGLQAYEDSEPLRQVVQLAFMTLNSSEDKHD